MSIYRISIDLGNAAFEAQEGAEVARILRDVAEECEEGGVAENLTLHDINGNTVGQANRSKR